MSNVNARYLEDENGNIISPIVSPEAVIFEDGSNLTKYIGMDILWQGDAHTNDNTGAWQHQALSNSWENYKLILAYIGNTTGECVPVILIPRTIKAFTCTWKCEALGAYYNGGLISLNNNNKKQLDWNCRYSVGWNGASLFGVYGIK
jgi:hypothetical protein